MSTSQNNIAARFGVGQPLRRREDERLLRGAGRYVDDIEHEGQLWAAFLRSPHAHAILKLVDTAEAKKAPGVLAVWTAADAAAAGVGDLTSWAPVQRVDGSPIAPVTMPVLARDRVRFVGQPIAMAVATSRAAAEEAIERIEIDFQELPSVVSAEAAMSADAPELHAQAPGNVALDWEVGDAAATDAAFAAAAEVVSVRTRNQRLIVASMEPRGLNAQYDAAEGRWTLHIGTQGVHMLRMILAKSLGAPEDRLRLITPDVGGAFGMKMMIHPEYPLVAAAARDLGRPVKWTASREESFLSDAQGRDLTTQAEGAFDADGRMLAMRARSVANLGAYYSQFGAGVHGPFSAAIVGALYKVPQAYAGLTSVFTNTTPTDAYRGAGRPEINFAAEDLMEAAALRFDLDPAEIRRRNLLAKEDFPHTNSTGVTYDSGDCHAVLSAALDAADWEGRAARRAESAARGRVRGVGLCYYMERTAGSPVEEARIRLRRDGRLEATIGTQASGQGHETAWSQLIAEKLGVPPELIDFAPNDSDLLPAGGGTGGSRSLIMAHRTFFMAADDVVAQAKSLAAERLEAAEADIEFRADEGGRFRIKGTDRTIGLFEAAAEQEILGAGSVAESSPTFPNGAHIAEIELDPETGEVAPLRYVIVDDFGRVLNPLLAAGQVHGGAAQGIGQALLEGAAWDEESGQPLTGSMLDYILPRADDLPNFETSMLEVAPTPSNPLGVKGAGEAGTVGGIPAMIFAVRDALRHAGAGEDAIAALEPPFTPCKVWKALQ